MEHPPLAVTAHRQRDVGHGGVAQRGAAIGLLPRPHAVEEVVHMLVVALVAKAGHDDFRLAPLLDELLTIGLLGDDLRVIELPVLGSFPFVAQEHGGLGAAQHGDGPDFVHLRRFHRDRILARIIGGIHEGIGNLAAVVVDPQAAHAGHACGVLIAERHVEGRHDVIVQIGGDAARVVPVFAETEEAIGIERARRRRADPLLPVDIVIACALRTGLRIDVPIPVALRIVAAVSALRGHHLAEHAALDHLAHLVPARPGGALHADLHDALASRARAHNSLASASVWVMGFSRYTSLPAAMAASAMGACQWSGVAMKTASISARCRSSWWCRYALAPSASPAAFVSRLRYTSHTATTWTSPRAFCRRRQAFR